MATEIPQAPNPRTVDLTGLPEPVVQQVLRLVREAREQQSRRTSGSDRPATPPATEFPPATGDAEAFPKFISRPELSPEEFRQKLREMAAMGTGKVLPPDFSRADIYDDHD